MDGKSSESLDSQINRLAIYIMEEIPDEPSRDQGAIDTAIRLLEQYRATLRELEQGEYESIYQRPDRDLMGDAD